LADYRDYYPQILAAGASVAAVAVDSTTQSEALRAQLSLPFPILCDIERRVVREYNLLNAQERGGIAKPSVFVIDPGLRIRYEAVDRVGTRVPASEVLSLLKAAGEAPTIKRQAYWPLVGDWIRAIRNNFGRH
jgi:peroxiredoxin